MDEPATPSTSTTKPVRRSKILAALDAELPNWLADGPLVPDAANLVASSRWVLTLSSCDVFGANTNSLHSYGAAHVKPLQWGS